ncbi:hypothetical protein VA596_46600 [Amycolatopsis sp., V23-08]|uniref:Uncharacterized protein n=1 Tax=Amycolatopsis heterodermiae TaxID=3110235 RepID=A0ABU5RLB5_9PSEU|nr:hypothetical protein [Amycolatopsis sp., V23-08]MEA5367072.1 hypothetical protein [Amycolatopsis sp., V23-08]
MTDLPPAVLLDEMARLKTRTRADRHAYVPPLLLFGVLVLLAPLWPSAGPARFGAGIVWFGTPLERYWLVAVVGGFLATACWYLYRGTRHGVRTPIRGYLAIGFVGVVAISFGLPVVESFAYRVERSPYAEPSFAVPVMVIATAVLVGVLWLRSTFESRAARAATTAAAVLASLVALGALDLRFAPVRPYAPLVTIALGLIGLAWLERSRVLGVLSGVFATAAVLANLHTVQNVFTNTVVPGLVLLVGAAVAWFHERGARA